MAKMIPQDIAYLSGASTSEEKDLYRIIERHTPNDWICYVGQCLGIDIEPDFLLIGADLGILLLEEKSIPITLIEKFTTKTWTVGIDGAPPHVITHPLQRARSYIQKLANRLKKVNRLTNINGRLKFVCGYGVILSNIQKDEMEQSDIEKFSTPLIETFQPHLVICKNQLPSNRQQESNFANQLKKMTQQFKFKPLDNEDIFSIRGALFPEPRIRSANGITYKKSVAESFTIEKDQMTRGDSKNDGEYAKALYKNNSFSEGNGIDTEEFRYVEDSAIFKTTPVKKPMPFRLLDGSHLMEKWNMDAYEIINLIRFYGLLSYDSIFSVNTNPDYFYPNLISELTTQDYESQKMKMKRFRFDPVVVDDFEKSHSKMFEVSAKGIHQFTKYPIKQIENNTSSGLPEKKPRPSQRHRDAVRQVAKRMWEKFPDMTIADMIGKDEINKAYLSEREDLYSEKTLRNWLSGLHPDPKPGRPPKKKELGK